MALGDGARRFVRRLNDHLNTNLSRLAAQSGVDLRSDAPWTDRSGDARSSLETALARESAGAHTRYTLTIGYTAEPGAPHGIFLEKKNAGNFAAVDPEAERLVPQVRRAVRMAGAMA